MGRGELFRRDETMSSKYQLFDRRRLLLKPLVDRVHDLDFNYCISPDDAPIPYTHPDLPTVATRIITAKEKNAARILMMGAHVIKAGANRVVIDLMERGLINHVALNGAGIIHDYELARIGATSESVARYIRSGEFGLWKETGELNDWIAEAADSARGLGENVGRRLMQSGYAHLEQSILAAAYRLCVPATAHVGIGYDIIHEHPNCDGSKLGAASYTDFLIYVRTIENLEHGIMLNFGSAIMGPEVYLKALSMARNVAHQNGQSIRQFCTAVFDLVPIRQDIHGDLDKDDPGYYFRPRKTILVRTVADGGESFYFCGDHRATLPALRRALLKQL
jgi:hypothetical protein